MTNPLQKTVDIGFDMNVRIWEPAAQRDHPPFLLVHGLASNAQTWDGVGRALAMAGYMAVGVDQRGHGLSQKMADGYDFGTVTADLKRLIDHLGWEKPVLAGQSWGGNVMLEFGARYPKVASGYVWVDGGFLNVGGDGEAWENIYERLLPPDLDGVPRADIEARLKAAHPDWSAEGIEATLNNFETMPDRTIRRRLALNNHMEIVRHLFEQNPNALFPTVAEPVFIAVAGDKARDARKRKLIEAAQAVPDVKVEWFNGDHDLHVQMPGRLTDSILRWVDQAVVGNG